MSDSKFEIGPEKNAADAANAPDAAAKQPLDPNAEGITAVLSNSALAGLAAADLLSAADLFTQVSGHQVLKELGRGGAGIVLLSKMGHHRSS
jgi:hypothetical protein